MSVTIQGYGRGPLPVVSKEQFQKLALPLEEYARELTHDTASQKVCRLWLGRHGQSQGNADKVNIGSGESPLTVAGRAQARALGKTLANLGIEFSLVVCSPLSRTSQSAEEIDTVWQEIKGRPLPKPFVIEPGVGERYCGKALQGENIKEEFYKPFKEREERDIASLVNFEDKFEYKMRYEDGTRVEDQESLAMSYTKGLPELLKIAKENLGKDVLLSTHVGFMRSMIIGLTSIGYTEHETALALEVRSFDLPNGACIVLESDGEKIWLKAASDLTFKR